MCPSESITIIADALLTPRTAGSSARPSAAGVRPSIDSGVGDRPRRAGGRAAGHARARREHRRGGRTGALRLAVALVLRQRWIGMCWLLPTHTKSLVMTC